MEQYFITGAVASVVVLAITVWRIERSLTSVRSELAIHRAAIALYADQFSIARDLLVCHHLKLEFEDNDPETFIWPDDDELEPMDFR